MGALVPEWCPAISSAGRAILVGRAASPAIVRRSQMRVPYSRELQELPTTLATAIEADLTPLRRALLRVGGGPARFIGTGGTLALARLAADLHEDAVRQPARVLTPLQFVQAPRLGRTGVVLFSARAKHPDALLALNEMSGGWYRPAVLVTHRASEEIATAEKTDLRVVQVPKPALREGFLATNSVLAMAAMLVQAHGANLTSDVIEDSGGYAEQVPIERQRLLVLYPPSLAAVAIDIETRLSELGLAAVQLADLRNIAHGRHTGLARNAADTTVLTISDRDSGVFAQAVTDIVRTSGAAHAHWHADLEWPLATIRLLVASMHLTHRFASAQGVDAGRPSVPQFGRVLYNQPIRRLLHRAAEGAVERKLAALGIGTAPTETREKFAEAYVAWRRALASTVFGGLVLDYDGTVCATSRRTQHPRGDIQDELIGLLGRGLSLGFASGRGRSLHVALREWVPKEHWDRVMVGLYNGAVRLPLTDDLEDIREPSELMAAANERLLSSVLAGLVTAEPRSAQVTVHAAAAPFRPDRLAEIVSDVLTGGEPLPVKIVASGHSLDVVAVDTSKVAVLDDLRSTTGCDVLAIGDQGDLGGNDFEMLASTEWSITVDRCSPDPTRCWPTDELGRRGPEALLAILKSLRHENGNVHLPTTKTRSRRA